MSQQPVNIGASANDGTGDTLRAAFAKLNANDAELYAANALTPAALLALLLTVDGPGSGLNADLLDGLSSAAFALATHLHTIADVTGLQAALDAKLDASTYTAANVLSKLLTVDGAGSGLDADTLDGLSSAAYALAVHLHSIADVTGLQAALDAKLASASYTAADVIAKLLTVDGVGSGLDADLLDGQSSAAFAAAAHTHAQADITGLVAALAAKLDASSYTAADVRTKLLTVDGAGSGIDADLLDGLSSAAFAAASHAHAIAEVTGLQAALDAKGDLSSAVSVSVDSEVALFSGTTGKLLKRATGTGLATLTAGVLSLTDPASFAAAVHAHAITDVTGLTAALAAKLDSSVYTPADVLSKLLTVDGAGSGLDADLLDGMSSAAFAAAVHTHAQSEVTGLTAALAAKLDASSYTAADVLSKLLTVDGSGSGIDADLLDGQSSAAFLLASSYTAADVLSKLLTVDGSGSGLDADTLDALSSAAFLQVSSYQALTPTWSADHTFQSRIFLTAAAIPAGLVGGGVGTLLVGATNTGAISAYQYAAVPHINLFRTNGSPGAETTILSTNQLGMLRFTGNYSTGTFYSAAEWIGVATEDWSSTNRGSRLDAYVTKLATNTLTRILQLSQESFVALENTESPQITIGSQTGTAFAASNGITIIGTTANLFRSVTRAGAASFQSIRINGTSASPTAIASNDIIGQWAARGATDTTPTIASGALVTFQATEAWSGSQRGCKLLLQSVANGATTASTTLVAHGTQNQALDGTAALPSWAFQNSLAMGLYRIANNQLGVSCNATLVLDISTSLFAITATTVRLNTTSATTVGAAGGASALPITPLGYITANVNGTACKIPFYNT